MSWYLSVAERQAIDEAIPYDRDPARSTLREWRQHKFGEGTEHEALRNALGLRSEQLEKDYIKVCPITESEVLGNVDRRKERIGRIRRIRNFVQKQTKMEPRLQERALYVLEREIARASNYERLRMIEKWWTGQPYRPRP